MESSQSSLSVSLTSPEGSQCFDGHILNKMGVFGVHFGDPSFLRAIPLPEEAAAPDGYAFRMGDFRRPLWINPNFPYLVLLPRFNPFYGPIFSCLNVTNKNVPIEEVVSFALGEKEPRYRWGLAQSLVDRWLHLESVLWLTLRTMIILYGGPAAEGVYPFLAPICYRYTERNASSFSNAVDIALRSRDAFLPLMAEITLMFILLDAKDHNDWRGRLQTSTNLHWQWIADLECSAVGDFSIDRLGGIIDLTLTKSHPDHRLPRHSRWLLPHLLGKHRVPLYFFYGRQFPLQEPIPDALTSVGFVPTADELEYMYGLVGDVVFSRWSVYKSTWKRIDPSVASFVPYAPLSPRPPPTGQYSPMPADDSVPTIAFPAVERDSGQKQGENIHAFMERRRLHNEKRVQHESRDARNRRLAKEAHAAKGGPPGKRGARVFIWEEEGGFFIRHAYNRFDAADRWDEFTPAQRIYDSFTDQWDLCTALAPNEEAEPEPDHSYDDHDADDDFTFYAPISPTNIIPSNLDVPGREAMEEENGERAAQVLERGYDLDREDLGKNADDLPGWQKQDVSSTVPLRFGFAEPLTAPHSSQRMQDKACAWAIGDETWPIPQTSALPIFLHHVLEGVSVPLNLCDLTSPDSDLELDWNLEVKILRERDQTLYEIRPPHFEASGPSILLESAATVLHIIRSGLGHDSDLESIIRSLVELGVNFHPSWQRPVHHVAVAPRSHPTLGRRPAGYTPTLLDFGAYVQQRDAFLRSSRGRAALFYGGIVGRLARLVIPDFEDVACLDPPADVLEAGIRVANGNGERALWREALTANEINLICGVYTVETGQTSKAAADGHQLKYISWWPTPTAFWSSGLNTGWWNANCERWFVKRSKEMETMRVKLFTYSEWKSKIRFSNIGHKVTANYEKLAANYLDARVR